MMCASFWSGKAGSSEAFIQSQEMQRPSSSHMRCSVPLRLILHTLQKRQECLQAEAAQSRAVPSTSYLNSRLVLTDCKLTVRTGRSLAPSDVFQLVLVALDKAVVGKLPSVWVSLAEALHKCRA